MGNELNASSAKLVFSDEFRDIFDSRNVCEEYLRKVISFAENTSNKLMNIETGHLIAHLEIGNITCWVEYAPEDDGYRVFNAYMHRLAIEEER